MRAATIMISACLPDHVVNYTIMRYLTQCEILDRTTAVLDNIFSRNLTVPIAIAKQKK